MATAKTNTSKKQKSGFEYDAIGGKAYPKGSTVKQNADGTVTIVPPKKKKK